MRLCIDIDGTICTLRQPHESYATVQPLPGAAERIRSLRAEGHYIILATSRHMATCQANVGQVMARQGKVLLDWLEYHGFEYDELWLGKPHADIYIDDKACRFTGNWQALKLPDLPQLKPVRKQDSGAAA
jgi:capsule biosynthesis phosphatase